jgi:protein-serine/threonine kinase
MTMLLPLGQQAPLSPATTSPKFTEDLSRFPSESLHSFSFAHQSEDFIHNRQSVLKRSIEFMKDRMGWAVSSNAAIASAQARVTGDVETQNMLDLLARARLVDAGNLPQTDTPSLVAGPLTGPADVSGKNIFDNEFDLPRSSSPEPYSEVAASPAAHAEASETDTSLQQTPSASTQLEIPQSQTDSENSSRTPTNESGTTQKTSPPVSRKPSLRRTYTDVAPVSLQQKLIDAMGQPFVAGQRPAFPDLLASPSLPPLVGPVSSSVSGSMSPAVHGHSTRWVPAAQAIFTTESKPPWTILAANDLACLVFGVTKAEVRKMGILQIVQEERRDWLETKLLHSDDSRSSSPKPPPMPAPISSGTNGASILGGRGGITAQLLSKPNSRSQPSKVSVRRAQTVHSGDPSSKSRSGANRNNSKSRGVILCGDVVPIQKRNGSTGSASLWVKEKRVGLIWVLEEIHEDVAMLTLDEDGVVIKVAGDTRPIWGEDSLRPGMDVGKLITRIPRQGFDPRFGAIDYAEIATRKYFTCRRTNQVNIPATVTQTRGQPELRVSSFPHIAGIIVVDPGSTKITSSNSVFCGALFGYEKPDGLSIATLLPDFEEILGILTNQEKVHLSDGTVIPEHSFRKASAYLAVRQGRPDAASIFLSPEGVQARHRDGAQLKVDVQMRVVNSEKHDDNHSSPSVSDEELPPIEEAVSEHEQEMVYALWVTYSRYLHTPKAGSVAVTSPILSGSATPLHQPSPGQTPVRTPQEMNSDSEESRQRSVASMLTQQLKDAAKTAAAKITGSAIADKPPVTAAPPEVVETPPQKKTIDDFVILEDMGQGAYGQVKLARPRNNPGKRVVLKYVTKRRILVDTWTRDRRLGTVPLEIHVLDYLRRDGLKHPNVVEMLDFFEDDTNYYIEMEPHGLPGMDLFDYIELRTNMEEDECRSIFVQTATAIHHLHTKALVVHRDIKDENVVLDGEGNIKLIDFGSAAYIKSGPFDVFVGTIGELSQSAPLSHTKSRANPV